VLCAHSEIGTLLLNFPAALTRQVRIVWTVTILQQVNELRSSTRAARTASRCRGVGRIIRGVPADELSKGWRFFPTYAEVQTGSVLRQPFPSAA
jgi:hypothetical protein